MYIVGAELVGTITGFSMALLDVSCEKWIWRPGSMWPNRGDTLSQT